MEQIATLEEDIQQDEFLPGAEEEYLKVQSIKEQLRNAIASKNEVEHELMLAEKESVNYLYYYYNMR